MLLTVGRNSSSRQNLKHFVRVVRAISTIVFVFVRCRSTSITGKSAGHSRIVRVCRLPTICNGSGTQNSWNLVRRHTMSPVRPSNSSLVLQFAGLRPKGEICDCHDRQSSVILVRRCYRMYHVMASALWHDHVAPAKRCSSSRLMASVLPNPTGRSRCCTCTPVFLISRDRSGLLPRPPPA